MKLLLVAEDPKLAAAAAVAAAATDDARAVTLELVGSPEDARRRLREESFDLVALDSGLAQSHGRSLIDRLLVSAGETPLVAIGDERGSGGGAIPEGAALAWLPPTADGGGWILRALDLVAEREQLKRRGLRLARARRDTEALLTALLGALDEPVVLLDATGAVVLANGSFARALQRPMLRLQGVPMVSLVTEGSHREWLEATLARTTTMPAEAVMALKGDAPEPVRLRARAAQVRLDQDRVWWVLAFNIPDSVPAAPPVEAPQDDKALRDRLRSILGGKTAKLPIAIVAANKGEPIQRSEAVQQAFGEVLAGLLREAVRDDEPVVILPSCRVGVVFPPRGQSRATSVVQQMQQGLSTALAESPRLAKLLESESPGDVVAELARLARLSIAVREVEVRPADTESAGSLAAVIAGRIAAIEALHGPDAITAIDDIFRSAIRDLALVQAHGGEPAPLLVPNLGEAAGEHVRQVRAVAAERHELLLELDLCRLQQSAALIADEAGAAEGLVLTEVHYATMAARRTADRYLAELSALAAAPRDGLLLVLVGVPEGVMGQRQAGTIARLREHARAVGVEVSEMTGEPPDIQSMRASFVILPHALVERLATTREDRLRSLVQRSHRAGARLLVRGVPRGQGAKLRDVYQLDFTTSG